MYYNDMQLSCDTRAQIITCDLIRSSLDLPG